MNNIFLKRLRAVWPFGESRGSLSGPLGLPLRKSNTGPIVAGLLTLAASPGLVAQDSIPPADVITLSFHWPSDFVADVELHRVRIRNADAETDSTSLVVTYTMEVDEHADGKLIRYSGFQTPMVSGFDAAEQQLLQAVSSVVPSYVVSAEGELLQIDELDTLRDNLLTWMEKLLDTLPSGEFQELMAQMMSEETLFALAAQEWNALVGFWVDAEFEIGAAYELIADEPLPMIGNAVVPYRYEFGAAGRLPCREEGVAQNCVELIMRSYPDPESLQPLLDDWLRRIMESAGAGDSIPAFKYRDLSIENEIVLVTEPETLIPHSLSITKASDIVMEVAGMEQTATDCHSRYYTFRHRTAPAR